MIKWMKTVLLIENGSRHTVALAHSFTGYLVRRVKYRDVSSKDIEESDIIVLSGGRPAVLYYGLFFRKQLELIRSATKPVIGICLGCQLIARAYGVRPYRLGRKAHGLKHIQIITDAFGLEKGDARVWESHKWAIRSVPDELFQTVATSGNGVEIIRHKTKPIYGCQFHPEIQRPENDGRTVLNAILAEIESNTK
jgi:GMP synthase (glutamine-hydrolysing)